MSTQTLDPHVPAPPAPKPGIAPVIVEPQDGMPVDAAYATFAWSDVPSAEGYVFQVARDDAFADLVVDMIVGDATMLTLFETFRPDGEPRYARVAAVVGGIDQPYSDVVSFRPLSDDEYEKATVRPRTRPLDGRARSQDGKAAATRTPVAAPASETEVIVPYRMASSSDAMAYAVVAVGLGMMAVLAAIALFV